jgi:hypothetical protein
MWEPKRQEECFCLKHSVNNALGMKVLTNVSLLGPPEPNGYYCIDTFTYRNPTLVGYVALGTAEIYLLLPGGDNSKDTALDTLLYHGVDVAVMRTNRFAGHFVAVRRGPEKHYYVVDSVEATSGLISPLELTQQWDALLIFREYQQGGTGRLLAPLEIAAAIRTAEKRKSEGTIKHHYKEHPDWRKIVDTRYEGGDADFNSP